jgi:hypothetical protein
MQRRRASTTNHRLPGSSLPLSCWLILLGATAPSGAQAQAAQVVRRDSTPDAAVERPFTANERPSLQITRAPGAITLDGDLGDAGWVGAAKATNFSENFPREKAQPPVESEVWVTYDEKHLYLAFLAADDPREVRTSLRDRDRMWSDDNFGILLDTYGDASWAYFLSANPYGIQGDTRVSTSSGEDAGFDIVYRTEARLTERGYQVEMAVPFASLRFPDRAVQSWRATFWRTRPRGSRSTYTWAALSRDDPCMLCQFGTLTGIEGVKPGGSLELLPALVASQSASLPDDGAGGLDNGSVKAAGSLGVRYSFANGLTAEAALNPDFSQVESDVAQIDANATFALFFPERRPFFQEGSELFSTYFNAVYTRRINDPQAAAKLIGRMGRSTVAYLGGRDERSPVLLPFQERSFTGVGGRSISNIGRYRQTFGRESYVGALVTDRRLEDGSGSGTAAGVDGLFRFGSFYRLEYQLLASHTREPDDTTLTSGVNDLAFAGGRHTAAYDGEGYAGFAQYTSLERSARTWNFDFDYRASSPTFRADNGFETRNDFRLLSMYQSLSFYPGSRFVDQIRPSIFASRTWAYDGGRDIDQLRPQLSLNLKGQTYVELAYQLGRERYAGLDFDDIRRWSVYANSNFSQLLKLGFFVSHGGSIARFQSPAVLGTATDVEIFGTLQPSTRMGVEPSLVYSRLAEPDGGPEIFSGYILRTRATYQFTRQLFLRLVVQYNGFSQRVDIEPLVTYKVNPFTLVFLGSTHGYQDFEDPRGLTAASRQFFAKFQYLVRR